MAAKAIFGRVTVIDPEKPCLPMLSSVWNRIPEFEQQVILNHLLSIRFMKFSQLTKAKKKALNLGSGDGGSTKISPDGKCIVIINTDPVDEDQIKQVIAQQLALVLFMQPQNSMDRPAVTNQIKAKMLEWEWNHL